MKEKRKKMKNAQPNENAPGACQHLRQAQRKLNDNI